jgi:hypothetical protein
MIFRASLGLTRDRGSDHAHAWIDRGNSMSVLVGDAVDDHFFAGQTRQLAEALGTLPTYRRLTWRMPPERTAM